MAWSAPSGGAGRERRPEPEGYRTPPKDPRTLLDKVWDAHTVAADGSDDRLVIDRVMLHERQLGLIGRSEIAGLQIARPDRVITCFDQQVPTRPSADGPPADAQLVAALERLEETSTRHDLPLFGPGDHRGGVINVVAPEQGMTLPGSLVVGADAHVSTHGAFGALALVVPDHEVAEVVASGEISRRRPGVVRVAVVGSMAPLSTAKDLALWILGRLGPGACMGAVLELGGPVVRSLSIEARMTVCNLAAESGADAVLIAPDETTQKYLAGRPFAPRGEEWNQAVADWSDLRSDPGAPVEADLVLVAIAVAPQVTWGTSACQVAPLDGVVPGPDPHDPDRHRLDQLALAYQDLDPGTPLRDIAVDQVFIGSCANARIEDLRAAADVARRGRAQVRSWVVPGSWPVKRQAEAEGLHRVFLDAGFEWREPGCSLCIGANGDAVRPGERLASTANRPQRGLVGPAARVHLMSPSSAAATALVGHLADENQVHSRH